MKKFTQITAAIAVSLAGVMPAAADTYPSQPIEIVVNYQAGGLTDAFARKIAEFMPKYLPNNAKVVVVNKPGGAGTIGLTAVANAEPDGYTVAYTTSSPIAIQPLYGKTPFTAESFVPVAKLFEIPAAFNVHKDSDIQTVEEFIAFTKANPGAFTYASTGGNGSGTHLISQQFASEVDADIRHIPFEGTAQMTTALAGKQVMGTMQMPDLHRGGNARPLVFLTNLKPTNEIYKDTPTSSDLGIAAVTDFFGGVFAPVGTPPERIAILQDAFFKAIQEPEALELFAKSQIPVSLVGSDDFAVILEEVVATNREQLRALGLID